MLSVRLLLALCHIHGLDSKSIDFVLAFPQADLDVDIWMELPIGFMVDGSPTEGRREHVLKLQKSLYGLKQSSLNWFQKLKEGLMARDFAPSAIDPCLYMKKDMIVLTYVDDCIIVALSMDAIDAFVRLMKDGPEKFILTGQ